MKLLSLERLLQDRQESAEKMAADLAEELKALQIQKDALEQRNKQLEAALLRSTDQQAATSCDMPHRSSQVSNWNLQSKKPVSPDPILLCCPWLAMSKACAVLYAGIRLVSQ